MSRSGKLALGVVNLGPVAYMAALLRAHGDLPGWTFVVHAAVLVALLVVYLRHVVRNDQLSRNLRRGWALVLLAGNWAVFPIYWYQFVWTDPRR